MFFFTNNFYCYQTNERSRQFSTYKNVLSDHLCIPKTHQKGLELIPPDCGRKYNTDAILIKVFHRNSLKTDDYYPFFNFF